MSRLNNDSIFSAVGKKSDRSSKTAEVMAGYRGMESAKPEDERVCYDPYAHRFISREMVEYVNSHPVEAMAMIEQAEHSVPGVSNSVVARTRYFDDAVKSSLDAGIGQLVILGAGYDMRACRIDGLENIRVFEVDHPATQKVKVEKVREILCSLPGHVTYVPVDLSSEKLGPRLTESGYDGSVKTLFLMEGLLMYLPPAVVEEILAFIVNNSGKGSAIVFDYIPQSMVDGTCDKEPGRNWQKMVTDTGEPFLFGIEDGEVKTFLARDGFTNIKKVTSEDYKKAYFRGKNAGRVMNSLHSFAYAQVK